MNPKSNINTMISNIIIGMWLVLFASNCSVADREIKYDTEATIPQLNVLLVRDHLPTALTLAKERYSDVYLLGILVHVEFPQVNSGGDEISFEFRSSSNKKMSLIVFCQKACNIEETTTTSELPQCPSLEINNLLIESDEALELGLKSGGADYLIDKSNKHRTNGGVAILFKECTLEGTRVQCVQETVS